MWDFDAPYLESFMHLQFALLSNRHTYIGAVGDAEGAWDFIGSALVLGRPHSLGTKVFRG